jgi:CheY-like chemotaxis protein
MVKLLTDLHQGSIAVESEEGAGSQFTVWLPIRRAVPAAAAAVELPVPADVMTGDMLPGERVALVVEDDPNSAARIRVQLEAEGFQVLHAATGHDALVLVSQRPVSLITLDVMLPDMDGWEFLSRIKQHAQLRRIPVVITSIVADADRGASLGASAVLQKPISRQELYEALVDLGLLPIVSEEPLKVLIVDDDPKAVEVVAARLVGLPVSLLRAHGGQEAIELARQELPQLIILDLMMPEVNGFEVMEALNDHADTSGIPILIVTAKEVTESDRIRLNGYVTAIMQKGGLESHRFIAEVRRAMSGRRGHV